MTLPMLRRPNRMQRPEGAGQSRTTHLGMKTRTTQGKSEQMQIRARMSMSADGYVTTPAGWPAPTADPACVSGKSHGSRAAAASRSRDEADRLAQPRHRAGVRARARLSRRLGGDRLRVSSTARSASGPTRQPAPERLTRTAHLHPLANRHDRAFRIRVDLARGHADRHVRGAAEEALSGQTADHIGGFADSLLEGPITFGY